ncbi:MAG: hypothetical protein LLG01_02995 [Planctomycetaceae bacterium]|nr:hypothetical protein [Planctomycetaceae bacterium]
MTLRSIILGLLAAIFIATVGYFTDQIVRLNHFVGNEFPIIVFLPLMMTAAVLNPLLGRIRPSWQLHRRELAVVVMAALVACNIPGSGLLRFFSRVLVVPMQLAQTETSWKKANVLGYAPPALLPNGGVYNEPFVRGMMQGAGKEGEPIGLDGVNWGFWKDPLLAWMPLVVLLAGASIALAMMVHRTWSRRERLPYPIAQLGETLIDDARTGRGSIFRSGLFLAPAIIILTIHLVNGLNAWCDKRLIEIPMEYHFGQIAETFSAVRGVPWGNGLWHVRLWPTIIAFACFVASDVSFTLGISPIVWVSVGVALYAFNIPMNWETVAGSPLDWQNAGSAAAIGAMLLYLGRRHYSLVLREAMMLGRSRQVEPYEAWACRIFLLCVAGMVGILAGLGVPWTIALAAVGLILLEYVVIARVNVESGLILAQFQWHMMAVMIGLFGSAVLGLHVIAVLGMMVAIFAIDPRECLMPFVLNGLKICDSRSLQPARMGGMGAGAFLLAFAAAVPFSLWVDSNYGVARGEGWSTYRAPRLAFDYMATEYNKLKNSGRLHVAEDLSAVQRLTHMEPDKRCLIAVAVGFAAVILLAGLRLRYTWWPLHPIIFVLWGTWVMYETAYCFLIGWAIKTVATRLGASYSTLKTVMIGVIAGDLAGGLVWMVIGAIYYGVTGSRPVVPGTDSWYMIFPGG